MLIINDHKDFKSCYTGNTGSQYMELSNREFVSKPQIQEVGTRCLKHLIICKSTVNDLGQLRRSNVFKFNNWRYKFVYRLCSIKAPDNASLGIKWLLEAIVIYELHGFDADIITMVAALLFWRSFNFLVGIGTS